MYKPDFIEYLSNKTNINIRVLNELFKNHFNIFEVALILIEKYKLDKDALGRIWGDYLGFAYVDPNASIVNQDYVRQIGITFIKMNKILPLYKLGMAVTLCTSNPTNSSIVSYTQKKLGDPVSLVFCFPFDIENYILKNIKQ